MRIFLPVERRQQVNCSDCNQTALRSKERRETSGRECRNFQLQPSLSSCFGDVQGIITLYRCQKASGFFAFYHAHKAISNFSSAQYSCIATLNMEKVVPASPIPSHLNHKESPERVTFYCTATKKALSLIYGQGGQKRYSYCVLGLGDNSVFQ